MTGWTQWEQVDGGMICHNKKSGLEAEAARGSGRQWVVTVYREGQLESSAWATRRNRDEALAAAVALLPRRRIAR